MSNISATDRVDVFFSSDDGYEALIEHAQVIHSANKDLADDSDQDRIRRYFNITRIEDKLSEGTEEKKYFRSSLCLFRALAEKQKEGIDKLPLLHSDLKEGYYDALITLVGFSPQPLVHTVLTLKPKEVYLITSEHASKFEDSIDIRELFEFLCKGIPIYQASPINAIGSMDTSKKIRGLVEKIRSKNEKAKIAIDVTGGKKSMDVSAFLMGAIHKDIDIFYVDFEGYNEGKPVYGTEFLNKLDNPYDIYNGVQSF